MQRSKGDGQRTAPMSTSVAALNRIATGPTGPNGNVPSTSAANHFSTAAPTSTDANGRNRGEPGDGMGEATAPLMRFLLNGRNASFFATLYASEAVCLGMFRCVGRDEEGLTTAPSSHFKSSRIDVILSRLLPPIPRQLVMSLIWSATNFRAKDIKALIKMHTHASHAEYVLRRRTKSFRTLTSVSAPSF